MEKFKVIKKFKNWKTGEEIAIGSIIDVKEDRIEPLRQLGVIDKPVKEKRGKKKKE